MPTKLPDRSFEDSLFAKGYTLILGADEVGRGCIAGSVALGMCAVIESIGPWPEGLRDSKLVAEKKRGPLSDAVKAWATGTSVGFAEAIEVESLGINPAQRLAGKRAYESMIETLSTKGFNVDPAETIIILDGSVDYLSKALPNIKVVTRVKADQDCMSVSGASIIAKVARDTVMIELGKRYPEYGWEGNKGYGAPGHYAAIKEYGQVEGIHRKSWIK